MASPILRYWSAYHFILFHISISLLTQAIGIDLANATHVLLILAHVFMAGKLIGLLPKERHGLVSITSSRNRGSSASYWGPEEDHGSSKLD
jgi:hypothetical protein